MNLEILKQPFPASDIEWRVQSSGVKNNNPWAMVLAYVTARAIQNRLDDVFGPLGWKDEYRHVAGGVICSLSVYNSDLKEWVTKENGSPETQIEAFKGGISKALVRVAASGFGVGRYLYDLDTTFVSHKNNGKRYDVIKDKKGNKIGEIKWNEPGLPGWALPNGEESKHPDPSKREKLETAEYYNGLADEVSRCTNATTMAKWFADNKAKIARLSEADQERMRLLYKQYADIFKADAKK
jgi:hypothetical protein